MTREYVRLTKLSDRTRKGFTIHEVEGWLLTEETVGQPLRIQAEIINNQRVNREFVTPPLTGFYFLNMGHFFVKTENCQYQLEYIVRNKLLGDNNESKRVSRPCNEDKSPS